MWSKRGAQKLKPQESRAAWSGNERSGSRGSHFQARGTIQVLLDNGLTAAIVNAYALETRFRMKMVAWGLLLYRSQRSYPCRR
jgi:hypothetical protein